MYFPNLERFYSKKVGNQSSLAEKIVPPTEPAELNYANFEELIAGMRVTPSPTSTEKYIFSKYVKNLMKIPYAGSAIRENVTEEAASKDFDKFLKFVNDYADETGQKELSAMIFPVFIYFKLLILQSDPEGLFNSKTFFNKYVGIFKEYKNYYNLLKRLWFFIDMQEVKSDPHFRKYMDGKFIIQIAPKVLEDLHKFLVKLKSKNKPGENALLFVLTFYFHFENKAMALYIQKISEKLKSKYVKDDEEEEEEDNDDDDNDKDESKFMDDEKLTSYVKAVRDLGDVSDDNKEEEFSFAEMESVLEESVVNHPQISTVVAKCPKSINSVDFNDNNTEMVFTTDDGFVYSVEIERKICSEKDLVEEEEEEEYYDDDYDYEDYEDDTYEMEQLPHVEEDDYDEYDEEEEVEYEGQEEEEEEYYDDVEDDNNSLSSLQLKNKSDAKVSESDSHDEVSKITDDEGTENLDTEESPQGDVRKIRTPNLENIIAVKYLKEKPHHALVACKQKVYLLNTETSKFETLYLGDDAEITCIDIGLRNYYFATGTTNSALLYKFDGRKPIRDFPGLKCKVTCVKFHPNGIYLATGNNDGIIKLFEVFSRHAVRVFLPQPSWISGFAFSSNGKIFASCDSLGCVKAWDLTKNNSVISEMNFTKIEEDNLACVTSVCFHPNSRALAACNRKGEFRLWDVRDPSKKYLVNFEKTPQKMKYVEEMWQIALHDFEVDSIEKNGQVL